MAMLNALHESQSGTSSPDLSSFHATLETKPPTPVVENTVSLADDCTHFTTRLCAALESICCRQNVRQRLYGAEAADSFPIGRTPPAVKADARHLTEDEDSTTDEDVPRYKILSHAPSIHRKRWPRGIQHGHVRLESDENSHVVQQNAEATIPRSKLPDTLQKGRRSGLAGRKRKRGYAEDYSENKRACEQQGLRFIRKRGFS